MYAGKPNEYERLDEPYTYVEGSGFAPLGPQRQERRALISCANAAGLSFLLYLFLRSALPVYIIRIFLMFCPQLRYSNAHLLGPDWLVQLVQAVCILLSAAVPFFLYGLLVRIPLREALPLRRPALSVAVPAVFITLGVSALATFTGLALSQLLRLVRVIPIQPAIALPSAGVAPVDTLLSLLTSLLVLCVLPALLEEFIYRGVLMQSLRRFGDGFALIVSSVLFMLMHQTVAQMPSALLVGLVIGYFVLYTGSIWTGVLLHFCNNLVALLQQLLVSPLNSRDASLFAMGFGLCCLLLGLVFSILLARGHSDMFRLKPTCGELTARERARVYFASPAVVVLVVLTAAAALHSLQILP